METQRHSYLSRSHSLIADGTLSEGASQKDDSGLRIYSALQVTFTAAAEIARSAALMVAGKPGTPSPHLREMGSYVNSLVRSCTVALFKKEVRHAGEVLSNYRGRRWFEVALCRMRCLLTGNPVAQVGVELAIADALEQTAKQAYEIALAV